MLLRYENFLEHANSFYIKHLFEGIDYYNRNILDKAIASYSLAIKIDPRFSIAYINRGHIYRRQGRIKEAMADFTIAIRLGSKTAGFTVNAYINRAEIYWSQSKFAEAISDCIKAIATQPKFIELQNILTDYLYKIGNDIDLSKIQKQDLINAIKSLPDPQNIFLLKQCLDSTTALGKRVRKQDELFKWTMESGDILKEIDDYLERLTHRKAKLDTLPDYYNVPYTEYSKLR